MRIRNRRNCRSGSIVVLSAFMMVLVFGMVALTVDIGYLGVARSEMQASADSAAMAAAWELVDEQGLVDSNDGGLYQDWIGLIHTRQIAQEYAGRNKVTRDAPELSFGDIDVGYLDDPSDPDKPLAYDDVNRYNTVNVHVRRTAEKNGEIGLFFAKIFGIRSIGGEAEATAMFLNNVAGFKAPSNGENLGILPFALDKDTWDAMLAGTGTDQWTWDEDSETISSGGDGVLEVNLFPGSDETLPPGNRGTVDIGSNNNSTKDIARQIVFGANESDLSYHGGVIQLDPATGELELNGDAGISAGVKDELDSVKGEPKIIPLFSKVVGPGNNATYTIVAFVGVRILDVKLTGCMSSKRVTIQPAKVVIKGAVAAGPDDGQVSYNIYSPVWLIK